MRALRQNLQEKHRLLSQDKYDEYDAANQQYLNINPEGTLLREAQDIDEELRIMAHIYNQQLGVIRDFIKHLQEHHGDVEERYDEHQSGKAIDTAARTLEQRKRKKDLRLARDFLEQIKNRQSEIKSLDHSIEQTTKQVRTLSGH
jgi:hypothetical protein